MSDAPKIRKITAEKKAKIGVDGFYNVDKGTWLAKTQRAMQLGKGKGLYYDTEYGLVSSDPATITAFIAANDLKPLPAGTLDEVAPPSSSAAGPSSSAAPASGTSAGKSPKTVKAPSSAAFRERVQKALAALESGKFLNLSTMRAVKPGKKELIYNAAYLLAAKAEDRVLLNETVEALGGSVSGGSIPDTNEAGTGEVRAPNPSSNRVSSRITLEKRLFGTPAALNAAAAASAAAAVVSIPPPVPEGKEEIEEAGGEDAPATEADAPATTPAVAAPVATTITPPLQIRRPVIDIKPAAAPLVRPTVSALPFASKAPLKSSFTLAKPSIAPAVTPAK
jgi:hypothetical protein